MRKHRFRAFGLSFLALSALMAFMAVGAQANWLVLDKEGTVLEPTETVSVSAHTPGELLIPAKNLEIECKKVASEGLTLEAKSTLAKGKVAFSECVTFSTSGTLTAAPKCNPINQPIKAGGVAHIILHNSENYVLLEPETGKPFTTIEFGEECALTATSTVKGSLVVECGHLNASSVFVHLDCKNHEVTHLIRQASPTLFPSDALIYGLSSAATIDGIAAVTLSGADVGKSWGGHI